MQALLGFALLVSVLAAVAIQVSRIHSYKLEFLSLRDDLNLLAGQLVLDWEEGETNPYAYYDNAFNIQESSNGDFYYFVQDEQGTIIAPSQLKGEKLNIKEKRAFKSEDGVAYMGKMEGQRYFVVPFDFEYAGKKYSVCGVYDDNYIFGDRKSTIRTFVLVLAALLLVLLLIAWLWIIPSLGAMIRKQHAAELELTSARRLQNKAVTQDFPKDDRCDVYGVLNAMREVGGDVFGAQIEGDRLQVLVGDVSGKGIEAAFVMFLLSSFTYSRSRSVTSPAGLISECNRLLCDNSDYDMFCTMVIGSIDLNTLEMDYCNAGHMRMIVDGDYLEEDAQMVLGAYKSFEYKRQTATLHKGARLLLYTDGVTEERSPQGKFFGTDGLLEWVRACPREWSARQVCDSLLETLAKYRGGEQQSDDIAIMCIKL